MHLRDFLCVSLIRFMLLSRCTARGCEWLIFLDTQMCVLFPTESVFFKSSWLEFRIPSPSHLKVMPILEGHMNLLTLEPAPGHLS